MKILISETCPVPPAISVGGGVFGCDTYIGNGPNFMVKSIAEHGGVMPDVLRLHIPVIRCLC